MVKVYRDQHLMHQDVELTAHMCVVKAVLCMLDPTINENKMLSGYSCDMAHSGCTAVMWLICWCTAVMWLVR